MPCLTVKKADFFAKRQVVLLGSASVCGRVCNNGPPDGVLIIVAAIFELPARCIWKCYSMRVMKRFCHIGLYVLRKQWVEPEDSSLSGLFSNVFTLLSCAGVVLGAVVNY